MESLVRCDPELLLDLEYTDIEGKKRIEGVKKGNFIVRDKQKNETTVVPIKEVMFYITKEEKDMMNNYDEAKEKDYEARLAIAEEAVQIAKETLSKEYDPEKVRALLYEDFKYDDYANTYVIPEISGLPMDELDAACIADVIMDTLRDILDSDSDDDE